MILKRLVQVLVADDDSDDRDTTREAFEHNQLANPLTFVEDGEELLDLLRRRGKYAGDERELPGLILLDLNMPKKDGRECLVELKADARLRHIPVVVLTTSNADEDVFRSYDLGASSYIRKPVTFEAMVDAVHTLGRYWLQLVALPPES